MKKISFLILFILHVIPSYALEFYKYERAIEIQTISNKPIMISIMSTDCHYCQNMKKNVFDDSKMSKWITKRFIPVELNLDFDEIPFDVKIDVTPTFIFVNVKGKIIKKILGAWNILDFKDLTKEIR